MSRPAERRGDGRPWRAGVLGLVVAGLLVGGPARGTGTGTETLIAEAVEIRFGPPRLSRTLVEMLIALPSGQLVRNDLGFYNVELSGAVLKSDRPYDQFHYRFDVAAAEEGGAPLVLTLQRHLRPGDFRLELRIEDLQSGRSLELERPLMVPRAPGVATPLETAARAVLAAMAAQERQPAPLVRIQPLPPVVMGPQRVDVLVAGEGVQGVTFLVDGRPVVSKSRPPYSVELDFGAEPRLRRVTVEAAGPGGQVLARDEVEVNGGGERFTVRLERPGAGTSARGAVDVAARLRTPQGRQVRSVELFFEGEPLGRLPGPPHRGTVELSGEAGVLEVVARLDDGSIAEDAVLLNGPAQVEELDVDLVELYTAMVDRRGRHVGSLEPGDVEVLEDGRRQRIERFQRVTDLPITVAVALDTSLSMSSRMAAVGEAAAGFLSAVVGPQDRASLVLFADHPRLAVGPTGDRPRLLNGLRGIEAGGETALYDSLVFALRQLPPRGQRAVLLLSDGRDVASRYSAGEVMELARRTGVTIYTVGIASPGPALEETLLRQLAEETGGRAFVVAAVADLGRAFQEVERDLRARYMVAYYSSNSGDDSFRTVEVRVSRRGVEARTVAGYFP